MTQNEAMGRPEHPRSGENRTQLKNEKCDTEWRERYKKVNTEIRNIMKKAKEKWIKKNALALQTTRKKITTPRINRRRVPAIQDKTGKCLSEENRSDDVTGKRVLEGYTFTYV